LEGIISKSKNGKYDVGNCTRNIIAHLTAIASGRKSVSGGLDITVERSRLTKEQADKVARENAKAAGELLPRNEVEAGILFILSNVRTRFLAMPAKLGPEVAIKKTAAECADILTGGVYDCLEEVAEIEITRNLKVATKCEGCGSPIK
jgi:hypothetical protein